MDADRGHRHRRHVAAVHADLVRRADRDDAQAQQNAAAVGPAHPDLMRHLVPPGGGVADPLVDAMNFDMSISSWRRRRC